MFVIGNILSGVAFILDKVIFIYSIIIIFSAIISFLSPDPYNPIVKFLRDVTEPVYEYIRRYLPFVVVGGLDLSPIVVLLALQFMEFALVANLKQIAINFIRW